MSKVFLKNNFDVLTWNYRGCGDELNQKPIFYHSGATYDLKTVINHSQINYDEIYLVGFSLGGNLILKYLGENENRSTKVKKGVAISVPLHLSSSSKKISSFENTMYSKRFLKTLKEKVILKSIAHPNEIPIQMLKNIKTLADFDDYLTGPLHGFADAEEYYEINSSLYFLEKIKVPTLVLNALNDPFLSDLCFPTELARKLEKVYFEFPKKGGHVGFTSPDFEKPYYSELRAVEFISKDI
jgi:predicted alpha/beta-fold hydrolase